MMWPESRRMMWAEPRHKRGRVPAPMWAESRRRCGPSPGADVARLNSYRVPVVLQPRPGHDEQLVGGARGGAVLRHLPQHLADVRRQGFTAKFPAEMPAIGAGLAPSLG